MIGLFEFRLPEGVNAPVYTVYDITNGSTSILFQIVATDTSIECGPRSGLNFVEIV